MFRHPIAPSQQANIAASFRAESLAGNGFEILKFDRLNRLLFSVTGNGAGERMRGKFFERIGQPRDFIFAARREAFDFSKGRALALS